MAGRLYWPAWDKEVHGHARPTVKQLHDKLAAIGIMENLAYSDEEYTKIESIVDHKLNLGYTHYQLYHLRYKYALRDKIKGVEYETPQFIFMRMAMALAEKSETKMLDVEKYYYYFSHNIINAPTPNYVNLGTKKKGFASCCVYDTLDTAKSLATGDHIAYMMTVMSAGIGSHIHTRSMGDSVAGGTIEHQGKLPYYRSLDGAVHANLQNGRGGAVTTYYNFFDREVKEIQALKNPMTPTQRQIRGLDYAMNVNTFFAKKVQANEDIALFSMQDAPALYEAFYGKDQSEFERLYNEFVDSGNVKKFVPARNIILGALTEAYDTGRHYLCNIDLMNHHTPFKDKITGSNLCLTGDTIVDVRIDGIETKMRIDEVVGFEGEIEAKSYNIETGELSYQKITAKAKTAEDAKLMRITDSNGNSIRCTPSHKIYTKNRGYVEAQFISEDDELYVM